MQFENHDDEPNFPYQIPCLSHLLAASILFSVRWCHLARLKKEDQARSQPFEFNLQASQHQARQNAGP
jgi:hypothetical protein